MKRLCLNMLWEVNISPHYCYGGVALPATGQNYFVAHNTYIVQEMLPRTIPFLQTMTVADFGTTLAHLVRVCWSAAAGQLHLASIGDSSPSTPPVSHSTPPLSSSLSRQGSSSPSQVSKGVRLQAGICEKQADGSVSSKVNSICTRSLVWLV